MLNSNIDITWHITNVFPIDDFGDITPYPIVECVIIVKYK
jgi:hypothetical protein